MTRMTRMALTLALVLLAACGGSDGAADSQAANRDTLTRRQRDSILAKSKIPGASGVGRAMSAADSASARIQRANTMATDTTPQ